MKLIELKEVSKTFNHSPVLEGVNLSIEEGDILGIIGRSGSGKTTLLNLMTGFIEPTSGEILHYFKVTEGPKNLSKSLHQIKSLIGFAPQHNSYYPKLTVEENLLHFGQLYGLKKETLIANINNLLEATKLNPHRKKLAEHLSGGMQKRLDIACSLVHKPKILVLDEPTDDLDPILQEDMIRFLLEINQQGVTLVIASHQLGVLEKICNKIAIIHEGKVKNNGLIEEVRKPFLKEHFTINFTTGFDKDQLISILKTLPIEKIVDRGHNLIVHPQDTMKTLGCLLNIIEEENLYLHDMDLRKPTLTEIFEKVASGK